MSVTHPAMLVFAREGQSGAFDPMGRLQHVSNVKRGQKCECFCLHCREPMIANQGRVKSWYFSHQKNSQCNPQPESVLHETAKALLQQYKKIWAKNIKVERARAANYKGHYIPKTGIAWHTIHGDKPWFFDRIELEQPVVGPDGSKIQPDAIAYVGQKAVLFIEILVTHRVDEEKRNKLRLLNIPTLEFDLSEMIGSFMESVHDATALQQWDPETLSELFFLNKTNQRWVHHPQYESLVEEANRKAILAIEEEIKNIETRIENNRIHEEARLRAKEKAEAERLQRIEQEALERNQREQQWRAEQDRLRQEDRLKQEARVRAIEEERERRAEEERLRKAQEAGSPDWLREAIESLLKDHDHVQITWGKWVLDYRKHSVNGWPITLKGGIDGNDKVFEEFEEKVSGPDFFDLDGGKVQRLPVSVLVKASPSKIAEIFHWALERWVRPHRPQIHWNELHSFVK